MRETARLTVAAVLVLMALSLTPAAGATRTRVTVAVLPCNDEVMTITKFSPLMQHLREQTGFEFTMVVSTSIAKFEKSLKNGDFDFVFQDPNTYAAYAGYFQPASLLGAIGRDGADLQHGIVIVRSDRGIGTIEDLRGKNVMFGNELSAVKWAAARDLFEDHGIDIEKDLRSHSKGGCCEDIAFNVFLGAVDAGVVCAHFLSEHSEKQKALGVDANALVSVGRTRPVPERVFAARRETESAVVEKVVQALLGLDRGNPQQREILSRAELGGFRRAADAEYDVMRVRPGRRTPAVDRGLPPR